MRGAVSAGREDSRGSFGGPGCAAALSCAAMYRRQVVGGLLVVAGLIVAIVGALNLGVTPGGTADATGAVVSTAGPTLAPPTVPPTAAPPTVGPPTDNPDAVALGLVRAFFANLEGAIQDGKQERMSASLAGPVIDRYGVSTCEADLASKDAVPEQVFEILAIHPPAPWDYVTDNLTTTVSNTTTVDANVTGLDANGAVTTELRQLHVQIADGMVFWFTDCGTPLGPQP